MMKLKVALCASAAISLATSAFAAPLSMTKSYEANVSGAMFDNSTVSDTWDFDFFNFNGPRIRRGDTESVNFGFFSREFGGDVTFEADLRAGTNGFVGMTGGTVQGSYAGDISLNVDGSYATGFNVSHALANEQTALQTTFPELALDLNVDYRSANYLVLEAVGGNVLGQDNEKIFILGNNTGASEVFSENIDVLDVVIGAGGVSVQALEGEIVSAPSVLRQDFLKGVKKGPLSAGVPTGEVLVKYPTADLGETQNSGRSVSGSIDPVDRSTSSVLQSLDPNTALENSDFLRAQLDIDGMTSIPLGYLGSASAPGAGNIRAEGNIMDFDLSAYLGVGQDLNLAFEGLLAEVAFNREVTITGRSDG
ncbi:MAG: hypothetical protein V2I43_15295, partial [Parvularcula sp.]|nr:hypothetical protein [Parvularcula sp.]